MRLPYLLLLLLIAAGTAAAHDQPADANDKPVAANDKPAAANDQPVAANDKPVAANDKPVAANDQPAAAQAPKVDVTDFQSLNQHKVLGPHEKFGNPFGNPDDFKDKNLPNDVGTPQFQADLQSFVGQPAAAPVISPPVDDFLGKFELFTDNSGVSAMHSVVLPNCDHVLMYDATIWRISKILLPNGQCRILNETTGEKDCFAHSVLLNTKTAQLIPLEEKQGNRRSGAISSQNEMKRKANQHEEDETDSFEALMAGVDQKIRSREDSNMGLRKKEVLKAGPQFQFPCAGRVLWRNGRLS